MHQLRQDKRGEDEKACKGEYESFVIVRFFLLLARDITRLVRSRLISRR
jgi:hypothetical protein